MGIQNLLPHGLTSLLCAFRTQHDKLLVAQVPFEREIF